MDKSFYNMCPLVEVKIRSKAKKYQSSARYQTNPINKIAKDFWNFAKLINFRPIWSHWICSLLLSLSLIAATEKFAPNFSWTFYMLKISLSIIFLKRSLDYFLFEDVMTEWSYVCDP